MPSTLFIFCDIESKKWYLSLPKRVQDYTMRCCHNHLKVLPLDICMPTKDIPDHVKDYITKSLNIGTSTQSIIHMGHFSITLSQAQIKIKNTIY